MSDAEKETAEILGETVKRAPGRPKAGRDMRKQSLYLPAEFVAFLELEAARLDRSYSWIVQKALDFAAEKIHALPSME